MTSYIIFLRVPFITRYSEYAKLNRIMSDISYYLELRGITHKYNLTKNPGEMRFVVQLYNDENIHSLKEELRIAFEKYSIMIFS